MDFIEETLRYEVVIVLWSIKVRLRDPRGGAHAGHCIHPYVPTCAQKCTSMCAHTLAPAFNYLAACAHPRLARALGSECPDVSILSSPRAVIAFYDCSDMLPYGRVFGDSLIIFRRRRPLECLLIKLDRESALWALMDNHVQLRSASSVWQSDKHSYRERKKRSVDYETVSVADRSRRIMNGYQPRWKSCASKNASQSVDSSLLRCTALLLTLHSDLRVEEGKEQKNKTLLE